MDSHYHKVMDARKNIKDHSTKFYFAYSTILDREAFEEWRNEHSYQFFNLPEGKIAKAIDVDLTFNFPSRWWGGRVAGLTDAKGASVYGLLFEIPGGEWPVVQHKEGVVTGMSIEKNVKLLVDGKEVEAIAFTTSPNRESQDGPISAGFIEALVRGAESAKLPAEYISKLRTLEDV